MELHQLRCFVVVAEELHFGRAAKRLFMTQPPLSRQIQLLERSLGVMLLERNNRQVRLTAAGQHFLRDARRMLAFAEQAGHSARRLASGDAGRLILGFTAVSGYSLIPELLRHAAQVLPDVEVVLQEMVSVAQIEALTANMIDVGFVRLAVTRPGLEYERVCREPLVVVMPLTHPLAGQASVALRDLHQQPFVMYSPVEGRYFYDCIAGLFAMAGVAPHYVHYLGQTHSVLGLVRAGLGLAIVPASASELHRGNLAFRPLRDAQIHAELYMAARHGSENPVLPAFISMAKHYFAIRKADSPACDEQDQCLSPPETAGGR
ncbi:LysR family transcriptional regulator [Azotobacter beijerinckii]|uniref:LysR family transcriptional regulator n=1 Tax=Azotobacter beijerinckii TaxID=170623 RepID=UPI002954162D|nr:LysR family transcriptional regulator [Azotobacter beijerinckii]MDV7212912.1 LysR family transcriptional regulator [Azotobacter beijerinckii]